MIAASHAEEAAEGHNRVSDVARAFLDHEVIYGAELRTVSVVYCCSFDFIRSDQIARLVRGGAGHGPLLSSIRDVLPLFEGATVSVSGAVRYRAPLSGRVALRRVVNADASVLVPARSG